MANITIPGTENSVYIFYKGIKIYRKLDTSGGQNLPIYSAPEVDTASYWSLDVLLSNIDKKGNGRVTTDDSTGDFKEILQNREKWMTPKEVASVLNVTVKTVYNWTKQGIISARKIGGRKYYLKEEINALFEK